MTDNSNDSPTRTGSFRAAVRAGSTVTEYTRAGAGQPILLLLSNAGDDTGFAARILAAIADRFRVIAPSPIPLTEDFAAWLATFLDGLGLVRTSIVTEDRFGVHLLGFALRDPTRVDRLVILSTSAPETDDLDAALADPVHGSHPLLIVRQGGPIDEVIAKVVRFLSPG